MLTPALEERYDITPDLATGDWHHPDISRLLQNDFTWGAFVKLAQYKRNEQEAFSVLSALPTRTRVEQNSSFENLPNEVLRLIISNPALEPIDVVSLGLSSHLLWVHVLDYIAHDCQKAQWAGTPLVCTGTWTMSLPPAVYAMKPAIKEKEEEFFNQRTIVRGMRMLRGTCPAREYNWDAITSYRERDELGNGSVWAQAFMNRADGSHISDPSLKVLKRSLDAILNPRKSDTPSSWHLRNLSTREFISLKSSPLHGKNEYFVHVKGMPKLSLDKAILLRICWSAPHISQPRYNDDDEEIEEGCRVLDKLKRGKWAGNCFDVTPDIPISQSMVVREGWRDVTQEIIQEAAVWKRVFG